MREFTEDGRPVGRCIGCRHDFATGPCGGCGAVPGPDDTWDGKLSAVPSDQTGGK